jgi:hypothetical protein
MSLFSIDPMSLSRIASALERIADRLELIFLPPPEYKVPTKPFGREAITYLDEKELWELEQKEKMGSRPSESDLP